MTQKRQKCKCISIEKVCEILHNINVKHFTNNLELKLTAKDDEKWQTKESIVQF